MATADYENRYDSISEFYQGVAIVIKDGKYGVILMGGHEVIVPSYDYISPFKDGYSKAIKGGETKIIDLSGRECKESNGKIIAIPSKYDIVRDFKGGVACVGTTSHHNKTKWGVIDENCNEIFEPQFYFISDFIAGTAKYQKESSEYEESWGFLSSDGFASECNFKEPEINDDGSLIIERDYQINSYRLGFRQENDETLPKKVRINNHGQILVNVGSEEIALPKEYRLAKSFANGLICVQDSTGYWGAINQNGQTVIPLEYKDLKDFSENKTFGINNQGQLCLISISGDIIKTFYGFSYAESFKNGFAIIKQNDKEALINQNGEILIGPIDACISHTNVIGEFRLSSQEKQGLFNSNTGLLIKPRFKKIIKVEKDFILVEVGEIGETYIDFSGRAFINKESRIYLPDWCLGVKAIVDDIYVGISEERKWGFVDAQGKSLCQPIFDHIGELNGDIIRTESYHTSTNWHGGTWKTTNYGLFNKSSKITIAAQYDSCPEYNGSFYKTTKNDLFGAINLKGKEVLETKWKSVEYDKGYFIITDVIKERHNTREKYGIANSKGKIILEPQFQSVIILKKGFFKIKNDDKWMLYNEAGLFYEDSINEICSVKKGIIKVSVDGHFGYINLNGKKVILSDKGDYIELPSKFSWGEDFKKGIAKVWINGYENYVNSNFNLVINNNGRFFVLDTSVDYLEAKDSNNNYVFVSNSQRGLMSQEGNILISANYKTLTILKSDLYIASISIDSVEKYGVINNKEEIILPFEYTSIKPYGGKVPLFYDDKIDLPSTIEYWLISQEDRCGEDEYGEKKYGLINSSAKICIIPKYSDIKQFDYGFFVKDRWWWGVMNKNLEIITEPKYDKIEVIGDDYNHVSVSYYDNNYHKYNKYGIIDKNGQEILEPIYDYVKNNKDNKLPEGRFFICLKGKLGIIDDKYNILAEPIYEEISDFDINGRAMAKKRIKVNDSNCDKTIIGEIDVDGNFIEIQELTKLDIAQGLSDNAKVKIVSTLKNGFLVVRKEHSNPAYQYCAIIDTNNEIILPYKYHEIQELEKESFFLVKLNGNLGVLDSLMHEVVEPAYNDISLIKDVFIVKKRFSYDESYGMIDIKGNILLKCVYSLITPATPDLFFVTQTSIDHRYKKDEKKLLINKKGEFLIEPKYSKIYDFVDGFAKVNCGRWSYDDDENSFKYIEGKWGIINTEGKEVITPVYDKVNYDAENKLFIVSLHLGGGTLSGYFNLEGIHQIKKSNGELVPASNKYIWQEDFDNNALSTVYWDGRTGTVNEFFQLIVSINLNGHNKKNIIIPDEYDWGYSSMNEFIKVEKCKKEGIIQEDGQIIIECKFERIEIVSEYDNCLFLCALFNDEERDYYEQAYYKTYNWHVLNKKGQEVFANTFKGFKLLGKQLIALKNNDGKYSIVNYKGHILAEEKFDSIEAFGVISKSVNGERWWPVETYNKYATWLEPQNSWEGLKNNDNLQYAIVEMAGRLGLINKNADIIIPPKFNSIIIIDNNRFIVDSSMMINTKCERIVSNGNMTIVISDEYEYAELLNNSLIKVYKDGLCGCINRKREVVIPIVYESLSCHDNLFVAMLYDKTVHKTKYGVINMTNELIVPFNDSYDNLKIEDDLILYKQNCYWGAFSLQGELICAPKYDNIHRISDNLIKAEIKDIDTRIYEGYYWEDDNLIHRNEEDIIKWGLFDNNGKGKLPIKYKIYDEVIDGLIKIRYNDLDGFIDITGKIVLEPKYYTIGCFVDGFAVVSKKIYFGQNYKFFKGVINSSFEETIPCIFEEGLSYENKLGLFSTIVGHVSYNVSRVGFKTVDGRYVADFGGKTILIDNRFKYCKPFVKDCAISVKVKKYSVFYGLINSKSEDILPPIFKGLQQVGDGIYRFKLNGKYGLADVKGNILLPNAYDGIGKFVEDLALLVVHDGPEKNDENKLYGYVDSKGSVVLPAEYKFISKKNNECSVVMRYNVWGLFSYLSHGITIIENATYLGRVGYGIYKFKIDNKYGLVDANGNVLLPNVYDGIGKFVEDLALLVVKENQGLDDENNLYGYVDSKGSVVLPAEHNYLGKQYNQYVVVMKDDVWGLFSLLNRETTTIENATYLGPYLDGLCRINIGGVFDVTTKKVELGSWGYVDVDGQMVISPQYDRALSFQEGMAAVKKGDGWGFINKEGNIIVPCEYDKVESNYKDGKGELIKDGKVYVFDTDGNIIKSYEEEKYDEYNDYDYDDYSPSYDKYGGYNGYDDQTIDEVFGGDPSLTWNID